MEYAKSGRSTCKGCRSTIAKDELRIGTHGIGTTVTFPETTGTTASHTLLAVRNIFSWLADGQVTDPISSVQRSFGLAHVELIILTIAVPVAVSAVAGATEMWLGLLSRLGQLSIRLACRLNTCSGIVLSVREFLQRDKRFRVRCAFQTEKE